eukprot:2147670-Ditylum_brightwellii.AAC.1
MQKIVKCKLVDTAEGIFDLVEVFLKGYALMHWLEFKQVETTRTSKNLDGLNMPLLGMSDPTFKICLQEVKKHYFLKNFACLQKAYLCNHGNNSMVEDELCSILYQMSKTTVADNGSEERKKLSSQCTKNAKTKGNVKSKLPGKDKRKTCILCQKFGGSPNHHSATDCYRHNVI